MIPLNYKKTINFKKNNMTVPIDFGTVMSLGIIGV